MQDYNAKLSYIGLANAGPTRDYDTHVATVFMGVHGYAAPEYIATGLFCKLSLHGTKLVN